MFILHKDVDSLRKEAVNKLSLLENLPNRYSLRFPSPLIKQFSHSSGVDGRSLPAAIREGFKYEITLGG